MHFFSLCSLLIFTGLFPGLSKRRVAINAGGMSLDPNAIIEVKSSNRGLSVQGLNLSNPVDGQLVFDITTTSFWLLVCKKQFFSKSIRKIKNQLLTNSTDK